VRVIGATIVICNKRQKRATFVWHILAAQRFPLRSPPLCERIRHSAFSAFSSSSIDTLENVVRNRIFRALNETCWIIHDKKGAAEILGINPSTLRSRMDKLGIKKKALPEVP
jgi:transcriptional regulator with GAF, ATPase, and Fis domain